MGTNFSEILVENVFESIVWEMAAIFLGLNVLRNILSSFHPVSNICIWCICMKTFAIFIWYPNNPAYMSHHVIMLLSELYLPSICWLIASSSHNHSAHAY